jgi:ABC-2 type transport system permease protein
MLFLILFVFTVAIVLAGKSAPETLNRASIAIVDEDQSVLSRRIGAAFMLPDFLPPRLITLKEMDEALEAGRHTFVLVIPSGFQRDQDSDKASELQLNIDATRMSQAFIGANIIQNIISQQVREFRGISNSEALRSIGLVTRMRFNPSLDPLWFTALMEYINHITMLSMILVGAALIREIEHSTIEHLLAMPVTPTEIMLSKVWSMSVVVFMAAVLSLLVIVQGVLRIPIEGSLGLFCVGMSLHLFATSSLGIFLATLARNMPQFGLLILLVLLPLEQLSGAVTPRESMPDWIQNLMFFAPTTHFTQLSQAILYRGAGLETVYGSFIALSAIGLTLFLLSLGWFRHQLQISA